VTDPQKELIGYRRSRARETLQDAEILFSNGRMISAVNRIYYGLFYQVGALLLTAGLFSSKHSGVRALFNEYFVKTGKISVVTGKFYALMFEFRQEADYRDFVNFTEDKVSQWLQEARRAINELDQVIEAELEA